LGKSEHSQFKYQTLAMGTLVFGSKDLRKGSTSIWIVLKKKTSSLQDIPPSTLVTTPSASCGQEYTFPAAPFMSALLSPKILDMKGEQAAIVSYLN